jgi:lipopolysaccharide transport system permease protein
LPRRADRRSFAAIVRPVVEAMPHEPVSTPPVTRLQPSRGCPSLELPQLWAARELLYFLVRRDLAVRYRQTILGVAWAFLQPIATAVVFSIFFGRLVGVPSDGVPYPVFSYVALVPWTFFANTVSLGAGALVSNPELIRKIHFPRLVMPTAAVFGGLVDLAIALVVLVGMLAIYGIAPTPRMLWLPAFLALAMATTLGVVFWLSAMNVQFRDVRFVVPFILQIWLFVTPVVYPATLLSEPWRTYYGANPMAGVVEGFRWSVLGTGAGPNAVSLVSGVVAMTLLISGVLYFRWMERTFADVI